MILRPCDDCQRRTEHTREQWADATDSAVTIKTEYACKMCGRVDLEKQYFQTDGKDRPRS